MFDQMLRDALTGKIYTKYGLKGDPFSMIPEDYSNTFVNREEEQRKVARSLIELKNKTIKMITILGSHGSGKTHFLMYVSKAMEGNLTPLGFQKIKIVRGEAEFNELYTKKDGTAEFIEDVGNEKIIFLIDDIDVIGSRHPGLLSVLLEKISNRVIVVCDTRQWNILKTRSDMKIPVTETIMIDYLSSEHCVEILKKRISQKIITKSLVSDIFPDFVLEKLAKISYGSPFRLIKYSRKYFDFIIDKDLTSSTESSFKAFTDGNNIKFIADAKKAIEKLTPTQRQVLQIVIDKSEVTASELGEALGVHRVAALQHLHKLVEEDLLETKPKARAVVYYVPTEWQDEISQYLAGEIKS